MSRNSLGESATVVSAVGRSYWRAVARVLSLGAGFTIAATLFVYPRIVSSQMSPVQHLALALLLLGASGALMHGFGFRPDSKIVGLILGPATAWILIAIGAAFLVPN